MSGERHPVAQPRVFTPRELLDLREPNWSQRMRSVSLVAEDQPKTEHTHQTLAAMGRLLRRAANVQQRAQILRSWPAVHVVSTVGVATDYYAQGTFWPMLFSVGGLPPQPELRSEWGRAFLANLDRLGLPAFGDADDAGARFVGRILMHSGVPTFCIPDYFGLVTERRRRIEGLEPDAFVSWAAQRVSDGLLANVDKPVQRFLRYGGEYAVDVTDRIFELLDDVRAGGDGRAVPLPERFRLEALKMPKAAPTHSRVDTGESGSMAPPHVVLDPYGRGPLLRLPPVSEAPDGKAIWIVMIGNRYERVATRAIWPGAHEPASSIDVPIVAPERAASVSLEGFAQHQSTVTLVDDKDPLLVFGEDCRLVPAGLPLKGAPMWLLHPGSPNSLVVDGTAHLVAEGALPPGWGGWCLQLIDMSDVTSVGLEGSQTRRAVRRHASARIISGEPIPGLRTRSGHPVFASPPTIQLPPTQALDTSWDISVVSGEADVFVRGWASSAADASLLWDGLPKPLLGTYTVRVRGPWGRGATRQVALAEGLETRFNPSWRRMTPNGLISGVVSAIAPPGMKTGQLGINFGPLQTESKLTVSTAHDTREFVVEPPHMSVSYQSTSQVTPASILPVGLYTEDVVDDPGTLTANIGESANPVLHLLSGGQPIQTLTPANGRHGVYPFKLSQCVDTLLLHPQVSLALDAEGALTVARIRPRQLFRCIEVDGGALRFVDCVEVQGLTALIYPLRAPWRGAHAIKVVNQLASLPDYLTSAGPLLVSAVIEDPWVPVPVPIWPAIGESTLVDADGWMETADLEETQLSRYLAGHGSLPQDIRDLGRIWSILSRRRSIGLDDRRHVVAEDCLRALRSRPTDALHALNGSVIDSAEFPGLIVRSGLLSLPITSSEALQESAEWTRRNTIIATAQWASSIVAAATNPDHVASGLLDDGRTLCGENLGQLLVGIDPCPRAGRFDQSAERYAHLDPSTQAEWRTEMRLIPKGLLDVDTRIQASMALLDARNSPLLRKIVTVSHRISNQIDTLLQMLGDEHGQAAFAARKHPTNNTGWRALSSISLGLALAARHAARGEGKAQAWIASHEKDWADLACVAPDLVTIDVLVAEFILAARGRQSRQDVQ